MHGPPDLLTDKVRNKTLSINVLVFHHSMVLAIMVKHKSEVEQWYTFKLTYSDYCAQTAHSGLSGRS